MKSTFICPVLSAGCLTMFMILFSHIAPAHGKASSEDASTAHPHRLISVYAFRLVYTRSIISLFLYPE